MAHPVCSNEPPPRWAGGRFRKVSTRPLRRSASPAVVAELWRWLKGPPCGLEEFQSGTPKHPRPKDVLRALLSRMTERGVVLTPAQPIPASIQRHTPAMRQVGSVGQLAQGNRAVADHRADNPAPVGPQHIHQTVEVGQDDRIHRQLLHRSYPGCCHAHPTAPATPRPGPCATCRRAHRHGRAPSVPRQTCHPVPGRHLGPRLVPRSTDRSAPGGCTGGPCPAKRVAGAGRSRRAGRPALPATPARTDRGAGSIPAGGGA